MEPTRRNPCCLSLLTGVAIGTVALIAHGQALDVTLTSKTFEPHESALGGATTATISITNSTGAQINGVTITDTLPAGMTGVTFAWAYGCDFMAFGTTPTTIFGGGNLPANTTCTVTSVVSVSAPGVYTNGPANITTWNGNPLAFAPAVLVLGPSSPVPTLSPLALLLLAVGVAVATYWTRFRSTRPERDAPR
jgi:uncharacterized repeat protein (TIGR01451 family)